MDSGDPPVLLSTRRVAKLFRHEINMVDTTVRSTTNTDGAMPVVSVVVPAYRVASYIAGTLRSIFAQTFTEYEVIVVEEQIRILEFDPSLSLIYADTEIFGDHPRAGQTSINSYPSTADVTFERLLRIECVVQTSGVVARRAALVAAGLFDLRFSYAEDFDLWLRVAHAGRIQHNRRVLARHRLHRASLSADETRMYEGRIAVYRNVSEKLPLTTEQANIVADEVRHCTAQIHLDAGKRRILIGDYAGAKVELGHAAQVSPTRKLRAVRLCLDAAPFLLGSLYRRRERR